MLTNTMTLCTTYVYKFTNVINSGMNLILIKLYSQNMIYMSMYVCMYVYA